MSDLTQVNIKFTQAGETLYTLEIFDNNNIFLTQINFSLPSKSFSVDEPISNI